MTQGWACNWRQIKDWEWYKTPNMAHLFQHLIREANHEPKKWQGIMIERGQFVTGQLVLSAETGLSRHQIRTCLANLKSTGEIKIKSTNKYSIVTICNYNTYQDKPPAEGQQEGQQRASRGPAEGHNQQLNNENNENKFNKTIYRKKPTKEEFLQYIEENKLNIWSPEGLYDGYNDGGWIDTRGKPVKNWKLKLRTLSNLADEKNDNRKDRSFSKSSAIGRRIEV